MLGFFAGVLIAFLIDIPLLSAIPDLSTHREVKVEMDVQASPDRVWGVLTDFASYANWNPYIYPASGEAVAGKQLDITLHGGVLVHYNPTVVASKPGEVLTWKGRLPAGAIERTLTWQIKPVDADRVHVTVVEVFQGLLLPLAAGVVGDAGGGLDQMLKALRTRAELLEYAMPKPPLRMWWPSVPEAAAPAAAPAAGGPAAAPSQ